MRLLASVQESLALLDARERRRYRWALAGQVILAGLDLAGVLLIGLLGLLASAVATKTAIPAAGLALTDALGLADRSPATVAAVCGVAAASLLILKSVLSLLIQRWVNLFLANRVSGLASQAIEGFLSQSLLGVQRRPVQWSGYALVEGLTSAVNGVLSPFMMIVGDVAVLVVLGIALLIIDPVTTTATLLYFGLVMALLSIGLGRWSERVHRQQASAAIESREAINDAVVTYRESLVAGRRRYFVQRFTDARTVLARTAADNMFISAIPRFTMEIALVLGALVLVGSMIVSGGELSDAVGVLALFLAAVARVMPSLLRINYSLIAIRSSEAAAERTRILLSELTGVEANVPALRVPGQAPGAPASVHIDRVRLRYPDRSQWALDDVTLTISAGQSVALVGPTGAGKSSLVDVLLGIVSPTSGVALIDGLPAAELVARHPGAVAYVPQSVAIVHGTVRDNVGLGLPRVDDDCVWMALERAHLAEFVRSQPTGLDTIVGERGVRISGGQRQRLGLARALYAPPSLLVLDEATSSLDAETERAIADTISSLASRVTTITVAHRLATIRAADVVVYLSGGEVLTQGTFEQVRAQVPSFENQARLMGL